MNIIQMDVSYLSLSPISKKNLYLSGMVLSYISAIVTLFFYYTATHISISENMGNCRTPLFIIMAAMGIFTILYENHVRNKYTVTIMSALLLSIYVIIFTDFTTQLHEYFAALAFISITLFMMYVTYHIRTPITIMLLFIQIVINIWIFKTDISIQSIYGVECAGLINFAAFYIYLHTRSDKL